MDRSIGLLLIALLLAGFGLYTGLNGIALLVGFTSPLLMLTFLAQGVLAIAAAMASRARSPGPPDAVGLAIVVALTALIEAFVLGILPWLYAILISVIAIVLALADRSGRARRSGTGPRLILPIDSRARRR
jgi:hypothetical protein